MLAVGNFFRFVYDVFFTISIGVPGADNFSFINSHISFFFILVRSEFGTPQRFAVFLRSLLEISKISSQLSILLHGTLFGLEDFFLFDVCLRITFLTNSSLSAFLQPLTYDGVRPTILLAYFFRSVIVISFSSDLVLDLTIYCVIDIFNSFKFYNVMIIKLKNGVRTVLRNH